MRRLWPELSDDKVAEGVAAFRAHYDAEGCLNSEPYAHVEEVLCRLKRAGVRQWVVTNKPLLPAERILQHLGLTSCLEDVFSPDSAEPAFATKAETLGHLIERHGLDPACCVFVGDSSEDAAAAAHWGIRFVAAAYGYGGLGTGDADGVIGSFTELPALLQLPALQETWA